MLRPSVIGCSSVHLSILCLCQLLICVTVHAKPVPQSNTPNSLQQALYPGALIGLGVMAAVEMGIMVLLAVAITIVSRRMTKTHNKKTPKNAVAPAPVPTIPTSVPTPPPPTKPVTIPPITPKHKKLHHKTKNTKRHQTKKVVEATQDSDRLYDVSEIDGDKTCEDDTVVVYATKAKGNKSPGGGDYDKTADCLSD